MKKAVMTVNYAYETNKEADFTVIGEASSWEEAETLVTRKGYTRTSGHVRMKRMYTGLELTNGLFMLGEDEEGFPVYTDREAFGIPVISKGVRPFVKDKWQRARRLPKV